MTHEELLQVIDVYNDGRGDAFANALRAVVELHKQMKLKEHRCDNCLEVYPCPTIQTIEKELNDN